MAKKAYIGVDSKARKVKKGYIGIDGAARKIRKAYIGIGGVARPCWAEGKPTYYGSVTAISQKRMDIPSTNVGQYVLFCGGISGDSSSDTGYSVVDAYQSSLTRSKTNLSRNVNSAAGVCHSQNHALVIGGRPGPGTSYVSTVDTVSADLTTGTATSVATAGPYAASQVGGYGIALCKNSAVGVAYNANLTRTALSASYTCMAAGMSANRAVFLLPASTSASVAYAYDANLTRSVSSSFSNSYVQDPNAAGTTNGKHCLFVGMQYWSGSTLNITNRVFAFDDNLSLTSKTDLSPARGDMFVGRLGSYAILGGGIPGYNQSPSKVVNAYDKNLALTTLTSLPTARSRGGAGTIGDYLIMAGGKTSSSLSTSAVAYTIV